MQKVSVLPGSTESAQKSVEYPKVPLKPALKSERSSSAVTIEKFRLISVLGRGHFGKVYEYDLQNILYF